MSNPLSLPCTVSSLSVTNTGRERRGRKPHDYDASIVQNHLHGLCSVSCYMVNEGGYGHTVYVVFDRRHCDCIEATYTLTEGSNVY